MPSTGAGEKRGDGKRGRREQGWQKEEGSEIKQQKKETVSINWVWPENYNHGTEPLNCWQAALLV